MPDARRFIGCLRRAKKTKELIFPCFVEDFGESTYFARGYVDSQGPPPILGEEIPGGFQYRIKRWMANWFCEFSEASCDKTVQFMECQQNICMFRKA